MSTIQSVLRDATQKLQVLPQASPALEAQVLLCHLLGRPRSHLFAWPEQRLGEAQVAAYRGLLERRLSGEPLAHITGLREFWSLTLKVSPHTLIPRPETELLVEQALACPPPSGPVRVADLGTGSGAIALALASERPTWRIDATDRSAPALALARKNAQALGLGHVTFYLGDWFAALPPQARYDLILSNPPYIAANDPHLDQGDLPAEPFGALVAGPDGLRDLRRIVREAGNWLNPGGQLLVEHGHTQGAAVRALFTTAGFSDITSQRDLAGHLRTTGGSWRHGQAV